MRCHIYQVPLIISPDDHYEEVPILLSDKRDKINEENLINLMDMTPDKPPETKHVIESDQELLSEEHSQAKLLRWHHRLVHLPFSNIKI